MKMVKVLFLGLLFALSSAAYGANCGNDKDVGNAQGCDNGNNGSGGGSGNSNTVITNAPVATADADSTSSSTASAVVNASTVVNNASNSTGGAGGFGGNAMGGNATAQGGNANVGAITVNTTPTNTASGGNAVVGDVTNTNTANGGTGGEAVASATVESGAVVVNVDSGATRGVTAPTTYKYVEVQQAPAIGQGSFAIQGCGVAGNAGGSFPGGAGFLGFGFTPEQCYDFMLAQAYESLGEKKAACDILRNSKAGKRQEKRGITLPSCEPELVPVPVVVTPPPVDYVTKEELNRAFKASQQK